MKDIDDFNAMYFPPGGGISWPGESAARVELARSLMGLGFVEAHDSWISRARDILDPKGSPFPRAFSHESSVRAALAGLSESQRSAAEELIRIAVHGALFSALVSLDQFPRADLSISVSDEEAGIGPLLVAPGEEELHDSFLEWLEKYSSERQRGP